MDNIKREELEKACKKIHKARTQNDCHPRVLVLNTTGTAPHGVPPKDPHLRGFALIIYRNFMRPHEGLGDRRTLAEAAGITISGPDKWRTFIGRAALFYA